MNKKELIELVKARPALYDCTLFEYKSKHLSADLWREIAEAMGKSTLECKAQWRVIRSTYSRYIQKLGNYAEETATRNKPRWYLAKEMKFLNDFMYRRPSELNLTVNSKNPLTATNSQSVESVQNTKLDQTIVIDDSSSTFSIKSEETNEDETAIDDEHSYYDEISFCDDSISIKSEMTNNNEATTGDHHSSYSERSFRDKRNKEYVDPLVRGYNLKKCRVQLSLKDQNIVMPEVNEKPLEIPKINNPVSNFAEDLTEGISKASSNTELVKVQETVPRPILEIKPENENINKQVSNTSSAIAVKKSLTVEPKIENPKAREEAMLLFFQSIMVDLRQLSDRNLRLFKQDTLRDLNNHLDEN